MSVVIICSPSSWIGDTVANVLPPRRLPTAAGPAC
jgi:hypothetical protein